MLDGVRIWPLAVNRDARGSFTEVYSDRWKLPIDPRQFSIVESRAGTLRGMHLHLRHDEYFLLLRGRCCVGLHDLRPSSRTRGQAQLISLDGDVPKVVAFERGIVHGWYFESDALHLQAVSEPYAEYGDDDNNGCHWSDPELGLDWPREPVWTSERAEGFGTLADLRRLVASRELPVPA